MTSLAKSLAARALMRRVAAATETPAFSATARGSRSFVDAALAALTTAPSGTDQERRSLEQIAAEFVAAQSRCPGTDPPSALPASPLGAALLAFACDALAYASEQHEKYAVRLALSPFSGIDRDTAAALVVGAGERDTVGGIVSAGRLPLSRDEETAARRFVSALERIAEAYRAQGIGALDMLTTVVAAFRLDAGPSGEEEATIAFLRAVAEALDMARRCTDERWDAAELISLIDEAALQANSPHDDCTQAAPLEPHEREREGPVARRRGHFSASALGTYAECARKWYYRYVCGAVEDRGSSASFYGTAFHSALEQFHREFPRGDTAPATLLAAKLDAYLIDAFERVRGGFATTVEFELQKRRARRTASRYLAWFLERSRRQPFAVVAQEEAVDAEFDGYQFVGYIDRLDRDDATGNVTVVDYKTGWIAQSAAEYRERIARHTDFQLPFYYWARTAAGDHVSKLALVPLKEAHLDVRPIELEVVPLSAAASTAKDATGLIGIDELERARQRMIELARRLTDEIIERFETTDDPTACTYCAYANACRDRPRRREDRFGR